MAEDLGVPLIMAAVFTAGCYLIWRLEQRAEHVERVLLTALGVTVVLAFGATLEHYIDENPPSVPQTWPSAQSGGLAHHGHAALIDTLQ
ncbi:MULTISPECIES: hypothetical protein [unclassified Methylobacterium]|uniref:hypothetical protein n=1 Tax=unclassified Methylobacterium TaxID=2615210 RepID=UPI00226A19AC|nr:MULTISPECIES: hypothetical protein [unclassified Methylobacterium]